MPRVLSITSHPLRELFVYLSCGAPLDLLPYSAQSILLMLPRRNTRPQLVILEPHLTALSTLPILKPAAAQEQVGKLGTPLREKRARIKDGLEWILGSESVGVVEEDGQLVSPLLGDQLMRVIAPDPDANDDDPLYYTLRLGQSPDGVYRMKKRHCPRHPWAREEPVQVEGEEVEVDKGGWRWEWV